MAVIVLNGLSNIAFGTSHNPRVMLTSNASIEAEPSQTVKSNTYLNDFLKSLSFLTLYGK